MGVLQDVVHTTMPLVQPSLYSKCWWNHQLAQLKKKKNKLNELSYRFRALLAHPSHEELWRASSEYSKAILEAKREHWVGFLERLSYGEVWIANRYISSSGSDGGKTRIPTLKLSLAADPLAPPMIASMNEEKSAMLARLMFPSKPATPHMFSDMYVNQLPDPPSITEKQIWCHLDRLSPHKAPGPDEIPNVILKNCANILVPYLLQIFRASLGLQCYPEQWKDSVTCVIWKPGKPRYDIPKAYWPIALVNTTTKLLSSIVAEDISHLTEKYQLLPANHFGGHPGCCTANSLHLLVDMVKAAWCRKQVVSALFLDVEGAFPNTVTEQLLHSLRKQRVPERYVAFVRNMLMLRRTKLKFDNHTSS